MPNDGNSKQQWRDSHVWEFLAVLREHPPIGPGSQDAKMKEGGAVVSIWEPIATKMNERLVKVNEQLLLKNPADNGKLKDSVDAASCKSNYNLLAKKYKQTKSYAQ
jgi:hypothetical protein